MEPSDLKVEKLVSQGDYIYARCPEHPNATKNGYVLEHRIVMEFALNRFLDRSEVVHHRNGNKHDNRVENLSVMSKEKHRALHAAERGLWVVDLKCPCCRKYFTRRKGNTHFHKSSAYTTCSLRCRGVFSRQIQLHGKTSEVEKAISENVVRVHKRYLDYSEETG